VFVANPKKPPQIETILRRNKDKLLVFLKGFHNDKEGKFFFPVIFGIPRNSMTIF
jgi:calcium binding protein 39